MSLRNSIHAIGSYFHYITTASNGRGHGIHSPFVYSFIRSVLMDRTRYEAYRNIESLREKLSKDPTLLAFQDLGAGSMHFSGSKRRVAGLAKTSAKSPKYAQLLYRLVQFYASKNVLELGTSLGVSTSYIASAATNGHVTTVEGVPAVSNKATENLQQLGLTNVTLLTGRFDEVLPDVLQSNPIFDMVFIDGNHRKESTLQYFHQLIDFMDKRSIMVFDDIYWSVGMTEAWASIKNDPRVMLTIDLYQFGIVFFDPSFKVPQHFRIRF